MKSRTKNRQAKRKLFKSKGSNAGNSILFMASTVGLCFMLNSCIIAFMAYKSLGHAPNVQELENEVQELENKVRSKAGGVIRKLSKKKTPFPLSIRYDDTSDTIVHPGNSEVTMSVPKFWDPPIALDASRLMTQKEALSIGSKIKVDHVEEELETIFVAIASYRDWQCPLTVESVFQRAKYPERVRVAVVDQLDDGEGDIPCGTPAISCDIDPSQLLCKYRDQIDVYEMEAELAVGPCFARHIGHRMYRGEYYAMQMDAHVTCVQNWDVDIIDQQKVTNNEMAVQTTYLSDVQGSIDPKTGLSLRKTRPIMCNTDYQKNQQGTFLRHNSQPETRSEIHGSPQLQPYWAAGFSFGRGHFIVNVPYDQYLPMIFLGEEMSIGIRGFTYGYDFYAPEKSIVFHSYASAHPERNKVKHFWEHSKLYAGVGKKAMNRVLGVISMNPEVPESEWDHAELEKYGVGGVRTVDKFYKTIGIDVHKKTCPGSKTCDFVQNYMHQHFHQHLRPDGMGIDYGKIDFEYDRDFKNQ